MKLFERAETFIDVVPFAGEIIFEAELAFVEPGAPSPGKCRAEKIEGCLACETEAGAWARREEEGMEPDGNDVCMGVFTDAGLLTGMDCVGMLDRLDSIACDMAGDLAPFASLARVGRLLVLAISSNVLDILALRGFLSFAEVRLAIGGFGGSEAADGGRGTTDEDGSELRVASAS